MTLKHAFLILLVITILTTGIFLPYIHGDYDYFAEGISTAIQSAAFASLLLVPTGLVWFTLNLLKNRNPQNPGHESRFMKFVIAGLVVVVSAASLGAFASHNRFSAIIIFIVGIFLVIAIGKKMTNLTAAPYYLILIPLAVIFIRTLFLESAKNKSTDFVIQQSQQLIEDIELYKNANGHYPISLQSTIEDYKTNVSGIDRFHYEKKGDAYNLYFRQFSNMPGTEEIVMYNKLDEHEMTVHNQDLLRVPDNQIIRGYHQVATLPQHHWKIFYFD